MSGDIKRASVRELTTENGVPLIGLPYVDINHDYRLYYKLYDPVDDRSGFAFYAAYWVSGPWEPGGPAEWESHETQVECVVRGVAYFDGIRHLYFGDQRTDNEGYLYYPDLDALAQIVEALRGLVRGHCQTP